MNLGTLLLGVLNGLVVGLLAVGLVLVYKCNRFINLAHAQLGTLSALLVAKWTLDWGWNWWLAFVLSIGVGVATGLAVDRALIRPMRRRTNSPVALLLLTIGVSQLLLALTYIPSLGPDPTKAIFYPQPFTSHLEIGGVVLTGMSVLTMVLVPLVVAALAAFLRFSSLGKQIRATANNPDAARLCGVPVGRVSAITWGIAGGLSALSAVLLAPTQPSFNVASLGPYLLMLTLGAAAFGAFTSVPGALAGGLLLGLVGQIVLDRTSDAGRAELALFVTLMLIVLFRGKAIGRTMDSGSVPIADLTPVKVPPVLAARALVRRRAWWLGGSAVVAGGLAPALPFFASQGNRFLLTLVLVYALVGVALTMLIGWGGQVSLGHFAVVGITAFLTARLSPHGWTLTSLFLLAGLVGALATAIVGLPALRIRGLTLAVTTLGFAVVANDWLFHQNWLGSTNPYGMAVQPPAFARGLGTPGSQLAVYYLALAVLTVAVLLAAALRRSMPGRLMIAVRDNERASAAFGVTPATVKLATLAVSGFFAGVAGVLWADAWRSAAPGHFAPEVSIAVLAVPVIGGLGSLGGAVAAAVLLYLPTYFIGPHLSDLFGSFGHQLGFQLFLAGAGLVITMRNFPNGVAGMSRMIWQRFLNRRAARLEHAEQRTADASPLVVEGASMRFAGVVALDGARLTVQRGEIVGLIGPNGAGKTTLLNVISGVLRPQAGSVRVFGHEVVDLPPDIRAGFGLSRSFQDASLFAGLTVMETVQVALARRNKVGIVAAMLGAPWARATEREVAGRAREIVDRLGLAPWADALTSELSTGTRRICDLAAQVAAAPGLLLLDEPTAGVAQREAEAFGPLLRRIRDELDCAIVIVEHDMPLLMGLCDRVYAMEAGAVIAEGRPEQIREDPRVIASYLGTEQVAIGRSGATQAPASSTPRPRKTPARKPSRTANPTSARRAT